MMPRFLGYGTPLLILAVLATCIPAGAQSGPLRWDERRVVLTPSADDQPCIALTDNGYWLAFRSDRSIMDDTDIWLTHSTDGRAWKDPVRVTFGPSNETWPSIAPGGSGSTVIIAYTEEGVGVRAVEVGLNQRFGDIEVRSAEPIEVLSGEYSIPNIIKDGPSYRLFAYGNGSFRIVTSQSGANWNEVPRAVPAPGAAFARCWPAGDGETLLSYANASGEYLALVRSSGEVLSTERVGSGSGAGAVRTADGSVVVWDGTGARRIGVVHTDLGAPGAPQPFLASRSPAPAFSDLVITYSDGGDIVVLVSEADEQGLGVGSGDRGGFVVWGPGLGAVLILGFLAGYLFYVWREPDRGDSWEPED